jgi:hypothetical protein
MKKQKENELKEQQELWNIFTYMAVMAEING